MAVPVDCGARNENKRDTGDLMLTASDQCFIERLETKVHVVAGASARPPGYKNFPEPTFLPHSSLPWKYSKPAKHKAMSALAEAFLLHQNIPLGVSCSWFLDFIYLHQQHLDTLRMSDLWVVWTIPN